MSPTAKPILKIQLLGDWQVTYAGAPLALDSARLQAFLAFLLLHRNAPQSRQHLAFLFWPDSSETNARNSLRQLLFDLRRDLPDASSFVDVDSSNIQWREDAPYQSDVDEFERFCADAERAERQGDCAREQTMLEKLTSTYRGDLLPGCYDDWITAPREHLRLRYLESLQKLIALLQDRRDYAGAIHYSQTLLQQDPLHEDTYRQLMRLNAQLGNHAGVASVYRTCETLLQRELGIEPSEETKQVYSALLADRTAHAAGPSPLALPGSAGNLPIPLTSFVGREQELAAIEELLPERRLVTLTGAAGVGKSRLALEAVRNMVGSYQDGVWLVDLAPQNDERLVAPAVAAAVHVSEKAGRSILDLLIENLREKSLLLVLDNCEHLIDSCANLVQGILSAAPRVHILVTSRELLGIEGEVALRVASLSAPTDDSVQSSEKVTVSALLQYDGVRLFVDRAKAVLPTFALRSSNANAVREICRSLDGIPLALELAAGRLKLFTLEQIAQRLDDRFRLLGGGSRTALPRHQTLRAALDWSHDLLSDAEQALFKQLAVFSGGFTLESVEAVCQVLSSDLPPNSLVLLNLLSHLIDKSLVVAEEWGGEMRYRMLETVRQYALTKMASSSEADVVRSRHCAFFLTLSREAEPHLGRSDQAAWLARLRSEDANISAAMDWSFAQGDMETYLRFNGALWYSWLVSGNWSRGRERLEKGLSAPALGTSAQVRAKGLLGAGNLALVQGNYDIASAHFDECIQASRPASPNPEIARAHYGLGNIYLYKGDSAQAQAMFSQGLDLSHACNDVSSIGIGLLNQGLLGLYQNSFDEARSQLNTSLAAFRQVGDLRFMAKALTNLGVISYCQNEYEQASTVYQEALEIQRQLGDKDMVALVLDNLGYVAFHQGDLAKAKASLAESLVLHNEIQSRRRPDVLFGLAKVAAAEHDPERAARLFGAAEALLEGIGERPQPMNRAEYDEGIADARRQMSPEAFKAALTLGMRMSMPEAVEYALSGMRPANRDNPRVTAE